MVFYKNISKISADDGSICTFFCTCISFEILRCNHDNKSNSALVPEHFISPSSNGSHTLNSSDSIVGNQYLQRERIQYTEGESMVVNIVKFLLKHFSLVQITNKYFKVINVNFNVLKFT